MTAFSSGSRQTTMWQTPVSPWPAIWTPFCSSSALAASMSSTRSAKPAISGLKSLDAFPLGLPERERPLAGRQLVGVVRIRGEPERVAVPGTRALGIARGDVDEVDALDGHQGIVPPLYGAQRRWNISPLPSGSWKKAMWHTPESYGSGNSNCTPAPANRSIDCATSGTRSATQSM